MFNCWDVPVVDHCSWHVVLIEQTDERVWKVSSLKTLLTRRKVSRKGTIFWIWLWDFCRWKVYPWGRWSREQCCEHARAYAPINYDHGHMNSCCHNGIVVNVKSLSARCKQVISDVSQIYMFSWSLTYFKIYFYLCLPLSFCSITIDVFHF